MRSMAFARVSSTRLWKGGVGNNEARKPYGDVVCIERVPEAEGVGQHRRRDEAAEFGVRSYFRPIAIR